MRNVVLITGASRGLGKSIAEVFACNNYDVIINYNKSKKQALNLQEELINKYNINAIAIKCDISNINEVKLMFDQIKKNYDQIDCLINNAAVYNDQELLEKSSKDFSYVLNTNLLGTFLVTKEAIKLMDTASIINIASTNGIDTEYNESIDYDASKAGIISMSRNFANYLAPKIRVNVVAPGWVNTDSTKELEPKFKEEQLKRILLNRFANPEEVAKVVYFLASDEASYINKCVIRVDGGLK